jgi:hypothetical protein
MCFKILPNVPSIHLTRNTPRPVHGSVFFHTTPTLLLALELSKLDGYVHTCCEELKLSDEEKDQFLSYGGARNGSVDSCILLPGYGRGRPSMYTTRNLCTYARLGLHS